MYLHIGINTYVWSGHIVGIFEASLFQLDDDDWAGKESETNNKFIRKSKILRYGLSFHEVKSYVLTTSNELHCSNVNCRTLKKRWGTATKARRHEEEMKKEVEKLR